MDCSATKKKKSSNTQHYVFKYESASLFMHGPLMYLHPQDTGNFSSKKVCICLEQIIHNRKDFPIFQPNISVL